MRLIVGNGGATRLVARPVVPVPDVADESLEADLERPYEVSSEQPLATSPLMALLGCINGDPGRLLALGTWEAGLDWVGGRRRPQGIRLSGQSVVEAVETALPSLDLPWLDRATEIHLGGREAGVTELEHLRAWLQNVLRGTVAVTTFDDYETDKLLDAYESRELVPVAAVELLRRSRRGDVLHRCQHCGSLFSPEERADEIYCRRAAPGEPPAGRTCQQLGPQSRYHAQLDELHAAYRRRYKRFDQRVRRHGRPRELIDRWRERARQLLNDAEARAWSRERFERELDTVEGGLWHR